MEPRCTRIATSFRPTGLADGLAPKEQRYSRASPRDSPQQIGSPASWQGARNSAEARRKVPRDSGLHNQPDRSSAKCGLLDDEPRAGAAAGRPVRGEIPRQWRVFEVARTASHAPGSRGETARRQTGPAYRPTLPMTCVPPDTAEDGVEGDDFQLFSTGPAKTRTLARRIMSVTAAGYPSPSGRSSVAGLPQVTPETVGSGRLVGSLRSQPAGPAWHRRHRHRKPLRPRIEGRGRFKARATNRCQQVPSIAAMVAFSSPSVSIWSSVGRPIAPYRPMRSTRRARTIRVLIGRHRLCHGYGRRHRGPINLPHDSSRGTASDGSAVLVDRTVRGDLPRPGNADRAAGRRAKRPEASSNPVRSCAVPRRRGDEPRERPDPRADLARPPAAARRPSPP